jgi:beta-galactosidase
VSINGTQVLTNFDIFASAGAKNQALIEQFTENANASGQYVIQCTTVNDNFSGEWD